MKEYSYGLCPYRIQNRKIYVLLNKTSSISDWNFFKGKPEQEDVSNVDTAIREFYEEAGVYIFKQYHEEYFSSISKRKNIGIWLCQAHNDLFTFDKKEIYSAEWVELKDIKMSNNQQKILDEIILHLKPLKEYIEYTMV